LVKLGPNWLLVGFSVLTVISYCYSLIAKRFNIPSVLFLIGTGIGLNQILHFFNAQVLTFSPWLEILGMIGLVLIVLEAALDIKIRKDTLAILARVIISSLVLILITTLIIATLFYFFLQLPIHSAIVYAIPLSIMSSAIVIPSITHLPEKIRTFLMLEAAFSDVFGILLFYTVLQVNSLESIGQTIVHSAGKLTLSIFLSILLCFVILFIFHRLKLQGRVFVIICILIGLYAAGELLHFSPLIMILLFGLALNNREALIHPFFNRAIDLEGVKEVLEQFKFIIGESSFLLRTIFFTVFGMSIQISNFSDPKVFLLSLIIILVLYSIRFVNLKIFQSKQIFPELFIAPRGLITILLYLSIPTTIQHANVKPMMVLIIIVGTSLIMMAALIGGGNQEIYSKTLEFKKRGYNT
jgi:cell volume regulation protein A